MEQRFAFVPMHTQGLCCLGLFECLLDHPPHLHSWPSLVTNSMSRDIGLAPVALSQPASVYPESSSSRDQAVSVHWFLCIDSSFFDVYLRIVGCKTKNEY